MQTLPNGQPAGYGARDRRLAERLAAAASAAEADKIARDAGHEDAADARQWLAERS